MEVAMDISMGWRSAASSIFSISRSVVYVRRYLLLESLKSQHLNILNVQFIQEF